MNLLLDWTLFVANAAVTTDAGLAVQSTLIISIGFAMKGNYPNPFNSSTTISFPLPAPGNVSLTIYSFNGQKVRELVAEYIKYAVRQSQCLVEWL